MADGAWVRLEWFAVAIAVVHAATVSFWAALGAGPRVRVAWFVALGAGVLAAPLMIPGHARLLRLVAAVAAVTAVLRMWDLHVGAQRGVRPGLREVLTFLPNIFGLVQRKLGRAPRPTPGREWRQAALGAAGAVVAGVAFVATFAVDWRRFGFTPEHVTKVLLFFLMLVPMVGALSAAWRLAGGRGLDFMDNPFAARTPADFWRRYNRPVHQFMEEDLFVPAGGRRRPLLGAILVFVVSAAVHEYVFAVPSQSVRGYQTTFFLVQGLAVAATMRLKPRGAAAAVLTLAFNLATGVLFFASVNQVLPFYRNPVPVW